MTNRMTIPKPLAPREEILTDGRHVLKAQHASGPVLVVFDPLQHVGGVYHVAQEMWRLYVPIQLHELLGALRDNGFTLPDGPDLQTWLDAVALLAGARPN
ncbi:MAG: hypothetical protein IRZ28_21685 [Steroidobacteraceae bacterium]|nr:hypothetical protein [Steroidobacteraceae bacterium]